MTAPRILLVEDDEAIADAVTVALRAEGWGVHALPDGRSDVVAETTTLPECPHGEIATRDAIDLMTERLDGVAATCREVHDQVDEEDPTTADILHTILERIEQLSWMVSAENRTPK